MMKNIVSLFSALAILLFYQHVIAFNAPSDVPTWCGKPYMNTNQSLNPGGQFNFPTPQNSPLLYVTVKPRYSIFLESDGCGSFVVDASISHIFGQPFTNVTYGSPDGTNVSAPFASLYVEVREESSGKLLVSSTVPITSTPNLLGFSLSGLSARMKPYNVSLYGTSTDGYQTFTATTEIFVLPDRTDGGSAVKIDNLYGGLWVRNRANSTGWYAVFPTGYYADGSYIFQSLDNLNTYQNFGLNSINLVPNAGLANQAYNFSILNQFWDRMDEINLFNIYDFRFVFMNATPLAEQVAMFQNRTTLLMWYTADEPDGWSYDLNSTKLAYDIIKEIDPYHPVSLVLNCENFFYEEYTAGADIVFEDAYPVGINATYSIDWNTTCNTTYGDCGCDNCHGDLDDVSTRLDTLASYQAGLPIPTKPLWAVLQAFGGPGDDDQYWSTIPSTAELLAMTVLALNHNAHGIANWNYPSTTPLSTVTGAMGRILNTPPAVDFVLGANPVVGLYTAQDALVDVSAWVVGEKMMVGVANTRYVDSEVVVRVSLPFAVASVDEVVWGNSSWAVVAGKLQKQGLSGLEVAILILNVSA